MTRVARLPVSTEKAVEFITAVSGRGSEDRR